MSVRVYSRTSVCTTGSDEALRVAAERMAKEEVGMLVVIDEERPVGVLTDRDVALARNIDGNVAGAMSGPALTAAADDSVADAAARMGRRGVRRMPVVDSEQRLIGLISSDDVLRLLGSEIRGLCAVAAAQMPDEPEPEAEGPGVRGIPVSHYIGEVVSVRAGVPVAAAIAAMREHAVGCVAVQAESGEALGILTDRDVTLRVIARGANPATTLVSAAMSSPAVSCDASAPLEEIVEQMRRHALRRVLITREGRLSGIVTFDDLVASLGNELHGLGEAARRQIRREQRRVQAEHVREEVVEKLQDVGARLREVGGEALTAIGREVDSLRERIARWRQ
ncbi:MAG TPA: CBS domain-containing protein [Myxococcota bacterium]|nr:CBS domain-containing protein [Myxococcota bacterium]